VVAPVFELAAGSKALRAEMPLVQVSLSLVQQPEAKSLLICYTGEIIWIVEMTYNVIITVEGGRIGHGSVHHPSL
jgi:hypothetical protein